MIFLKYHLENLSIVEEGKKNISKIKSRKVSILDKNNNEKEEKLHCKWENCEMFLQRGDLNKQVYKKFNQPFKKILLML